MEEPAALATAKVECLFAASPNFLVMLLENCLLVFEEALQTATSLIP
jgi:hypothetical protein